MSDQDKQLSSLYRKIATEQPSAQLDKKILTQASTQHNDNKHIKYNFRRKYLPYSLVASVVFVALLINNFPQYYYENPAELPNKQAPQRIQQPQSVASDTAITEVSTKKIAPTYNFQTQETLELAPAHQAAMRLARPLTITKQTQLHKIETALTLENKRQAIQAIQQYIELFGQQSLPPKYHQFMQDNQLQQTP